MPGLGPPSSLAIFPPHSAIDKSLLHLHDLSDCHHDTSSVAIVAEWDPSQPLRPPCHAPYLQPYRPFPDIIWRTAAVLDHVRCAAAALTSPLLPPPPPIISAPAARPTLLLEANAQPGHRGGLMHIPAYTAQSTQCAHIRLLLKHIPRPRPSSISGPDRLGRACTQNFRHHRIVNTAAFALVPLY